MERLEQLKGGGGIAPKAPHKAIRLDSEEVRIRLKESSYVVDAVFELFNTGDTTTEWIGFPKWGAPGRRPLPNYIKLEAWVNGASIEFDPEKESSEEAGFPKPNTDVYPFRVTQKIKEDREWLVSEVTFPGHAKTTIRVTYETEYCGQRSCEVAYLYGTGSMWKDNIGKATFIIDSSALHRVSEVSTHFEQVSDSRSISKIAWSRPEPSVSNPQRYVATDFKPYPDAYLRIERCRNFAPIYLKANYLKQRPACGPVPMAPPPPPMPLKAPADK